MISGPYDVIIAAGGFARRYNDLEPHSGRPKSLLMVGSRPLVFLAAERALRAGFGRLLVVNNRPEWHEKLCQALAPLGAADVVQDVGYASTFFLARTFATKMASKFLFLYGHAPRPVEHLNALIRDNGGVIASAYSTSTKSNQIPRGEMFLEPPYLIDRKSVEMSHASSWASYFAEVEYRMNIYVSDGPAEPNSRYEVEKYVEHYASFA